MAFFLTSNTRKMSAPPRYPLPIKTESGMPDPCGFDWIHRCTEEGDLYFVANLRNAYAGGRFSFRQKGRAPELWDPAYRGHAGSPRV